MAWFFDGDGPSDPATARAAENSVLLAARVVRAIDEAFRSPPFELRPELICELNAIAMAGLVNGAGVYRDGPALIVGSKHVPPSAADVPGEVEDMCRVLASSTRDAIWRAAYVLWRVNWIHPFEDGNGRTARATSYIVLCAAERMRLPGRRALPDRVADERRRYWRCLEEADKAWRRGRLDVSHLAGFLAKHLRMQLRDAKTGG